MHRLTILLLTFAGLSSPGPAAAMQSIDTLNALSRVPSSSEFNALTSAEPESGRPGLYGGVLVGMFKPIDTDEELDASGAGYGWGLFLGYQLTHWLGVESGFLYFQGDYERSSDTLIPGTASNAINIASVDISIRIRASYQVWELRPFLGCGVSYVDSDLYTKDAASGLFENTAGSQAASWQLLAGLAFAANKRWRPELVWRWIDLHQEFGIISNGEVQVGGNMLHLAIVGAY